MKKILVPTDFSEASLAALKIALIISKKDPKIMVRLAHSYHVPPLPSVSNYDYGYDVKKQKEMVKELRNKLEDISKMEFFKGMRVETQLIPHLHVPELLNYKDNKNADLIICGIQGSKDWKSFVEGSHAEDIIRQANCPVMCVNESMKESTQFDKVVFASSFTAEFERKFTDLKKVFGTLNTKVHLLTVVTPDKFRDTLTCEKRMKEFAKKAYLTNYESKVFNDESIEMGIHRYAESINADLISMETHGHTGFMKYMKRSITESVAHHSDLPVMTISMTDSIPLKKMVKRR